VTRFAALLPHHQARLVALAISYHLSRPGSEIDPATLANYRHGLSELGPVLESQLAGDTAVLELSPLQTTLIATALSSVASELKMYSVFDTMTGGSRRPRSTAPGFDERLRTLFPEVAGDPAYASQLAEDIVMLRRELPLGSAQEAIKEEREAAAARRARKRWWQLWRR
jgi:hypothetical protein